MKYEVTVGPVWVEADTEKEALLKYRIMLMDNWGIVMDQAQVREAEDAKQE